MRKNVKDFYLGFQFSLFKDRQGLKLALKLRLFRMGTERVFVLKSNPNWGKGDPELTPKLPYAEMLAKGSSGKALEPEDI